MNFVDPGGHNWLDDAWSQIQTWGNQISQGAQQAWDQIKKETSKAFSYLGDQLDKAMKEAHLETCSKAATDAWNSTLQSIMDSPAKYADYCAGFMDRAFGSNMLGPRFGQDKAYAAGAMVVDLAKMLVAAGCEVIGVIGIGVGVTGSVVLALPTGGTVTIPGVAVSAAGVALTAESFQIMGNAQDQLIEDFDRFQHGLEGSDKGGSEAGVDEKLMHELAESGVKYNADDVIMITKTAEGKLVWLEKGNTSAGYQHILNHADEFATKGIYPNQLPDFISSALSKGKIVGMQDTRPIYEVMYNGSLQRVAITVGNNGFIVGANPVSLP